MAQTTFTADVNKTVSVVGNTYTVNAPTLPDGVTMYINEVAVVPGTPVQITSDSIIQVEAITNKDIVINYQNMESVTLNGENVESGATIETSALNDTNTLTMIGATAIPAVTLNGQYVDGLTINGVSYTASELPVTFTPPGGRTSNVYITGTGTEAKTMTITGTDIQTAILNGQTITLPYQFTVTQDENILTVSGEIYQLDIDSVGGVAITQNGRQITDGSVPFHVVLDMDNDTYLGLDGTHIIKVSGEDLTKITINGNDYPVADLPVEVSNRNMTATLVVSGVAPSEVHVTGSYINDITLDGTVVPVGADGSVNLEVTTQAQNHFITVNGSQPSTYDITWNDNGSTAIALNGKKVTSGSASTIAGNSYVSATPVPIPVNVETDGVSEVQINGKRYTNQQFSFSIDEATEIDVNSRTCSLTIDYGDNSYKIIVPQGLVTLTAPHRDGWIFDGWSSNNVGITSPKMVQCVVNLSGVATANLVAHYQRYCTIDKPNSWN